MTSTGIRLEGETTGKACEVFSGFWIVATRHRPGLAKSMPEINNRCLVFRVTDAGSEVLAVVNAVDPVAIPEVKALASRTGLQVRYIISPGGGHHLMMAPWHDAFDTARVLLCPVRAPRTANGKKLLHLPRVSIMEPDRPLPQLEGQLDVVLFRGLLGLRDGPSPAEGGVDGVRHMLRVMLEMMRVQDPVDELWIRHVPSETVIGGENLGWMYPAATLKQQPAMVRMMVPGPDRVWIQTQARKVGDKVVVEECWRRILAWPARTLMTLHDPPGHAFIGDVQAALRDAVHAAGQLPKDLKAAPVRAAG